MKDDAAKRAACFHQLLHFMRRLYAIVVILGVLGAGCRSHPAAGTSIDGVPVVAGTSARPLVPETVFKQLNAKKRTILAQSRNKIHSLGEGLPAVRAVSLLPVVAVAEQDGWFFYATGIFTDATTHQPVGFITGLAVRRGSREIIGWGIW